MPRGGRRPAISAIAGRRSGDEDTHPTRKPKPGIVPALFIAGRPSYHASLVCISRYPADTPTLVGHVTRLFEAGYKACSSCWKPRGYDHANGEAILAVRGGD